MLCQKLNEREEQIKDCSDQKQVRVGLHLFSGRFDCCQNEKSIAEKTNN